MWQHWVNFVLGVWVIITPYLNFSTNTLTGVLVVTGILIAVFAIWGAVVKRPGE